MSSGPPGRGTVTTIQFDPSTTKVQKTGNSSNQSAASYLTARLMTFCWPRQLQLLDMQLVAPHIPQSESALKTFYLLVIDEEAINRLFFPWLTSADTYSPSFCRAGRRIGNPADGKLSSWMCFRDPAKQTQKDKTSSTHKRVIQIQGAHFLFFG
jgi:hypothetical protein